MLEDQQNYSNISIPTENKHNNIYLVNSKVDCIPSLAGITHLICTFICFVCYLTSLQIVNIFFSVPVSDIKAFVTGRDCPHIKDKKEKNRTVSKGEPREITQRC